MGEKTYMGIEHKSDYTAAATMPVKLFHNSIIQNKKIVPYHVTMTPTNVCNAHCKECFCDNRDKTKELPYSEITNIVDEMYNLGTRAISLSGGGEPDCHPDINKIIDYIHGAGIDVASVSNGKELYNIQTETLNKLQWIRVSGTSSRPVDLKRLSLDMERGLDVDWGLSYVLGEESAPYQNLKNAIDYTDNHNITHLRIVSDMMHPDENRIPQAKNHFGKTSNKIVWQERTSNVHGRKKCLVNLLHPIIDTDGNIQPCCGMMIATTPPTHDFDKTTAMCHWTEYRKIIENQIPFNGKNCDICQYDAYNETLEMLLAKPKHKKFI